MEREGASHGNSRASHQSYLSLRDILFVIVPPVFRVPFLLISLHCLGPQAKARCPKSCKMSSALISLYTPWTDKHWVRGERCCWERERGWLAFSLPNGETIRFLLTYNHIRSISISLFPESGKQWRKCRTVFYATRFWKSTLHIINQASYWRRKTWINRIRSSSQKMFTISQKS